MLPQFPRIATRQFDIAVQDVQHAFAYAIHELSFTVRNNSFTQSLFGRLEYVKSVIVRFHSLHSLSQSR